jgi:hypothetical protein
MNIRVGGIFPPGDVFFRKVMERVSAAQSQEGPQNPPPARRHGGKTGGASAPENPHQRGFQHIVIGVGDEDTDRGAGFGLDAPRFPEQGPAAVQPGCGLNANAFTFSGIRNFSRLDGHNCAGQIELFAEIPHKRGVSPAFRRRPDSVLHMQAAQPETEGGRRECRRFRPPGTKGGKGRKHGG